MQHPSQQDSRDPSTSSHGPPAPPEHTPSKTELPQQDQEEHPTVSRREQQDPSTSSHRPPVEYTSPSPSPSPQSTLSLSPSLLSTCDHSSLVYIGAREPSENSSSGSSSTRTSSEVRDEPAIAPAAVATTPASVAVATAPTPIAVATTPAFATITTTPLPPPLMRVPSNKTKEKRTNCCSSCIIC